MFPKDGFCCVGLFVITLMFVEIITLVLIKVMIVIYYLFSCYLCAIVCEYLYLSIYIYF